ncbi:MAG: glycosyltransferase family 2 protein [Kiritimatiellae bacterium]|nr:glycosyltransferase family 2 protein [Kiritimatiellia bacterium]
MILAPIIVVLVALSCIVIIGGIRLRMDAGNAVKLEGVDRDFPDVAIVVPVSGCSDIIAESLGSILKQDYPRYEVVFSTLDSDKSAIDLVRQLMVGAKNNGICRVRLVVSNYVDKCGQKNRNLLTGISAIETSVPVMVFCDAGHILPAQWLRRLVAPIVFNNEDVTTSYHNVLPADNRTATQGQAVSVLFLHFLQMMPFLCQPWGGSTAIRRDVFEKLGVADAWRTKVVDDVSLACLLNGAGISVTPVPSADSTTPLRGQTFSGWSLWLTRQLMYLKLFCPISWVLGGLAGLITAFIVAAMIGGVALFAAGFVGTTTGIACITGMIVLAGLILLMSLLHPSPGSRFTWIIAGLAAIYVACWCHLTTWFACSIRWRDTVYQVAYNGDVLSVRR